MIVWPDLIFPPINLWSLPKQSRQYENNLYTVSAMEVNYESNTKASLYAFEEKAQKLLGERIHKSYSI